MTMAPTHAPALPAVPAAAPTSGLPDGWVETALRVTGRFEDSADPLAAVTGDFDGMGISLGVLQWNIGSGSLQPLVRGVGRPAVMATMPVHGSELWDACTADRARGLAIVRGWQAGATLRPPVRAELKAFTGSPAFVARQVAAAGEVAQSAFGAAGRYAAADPSRGRVDLHLFCWFFDLFTQNGGLKGVGYGDVGAFIAAAGAERADDLIADFLAGRGPGEAGYRDSHDNAVLWRDKVPPAELSLLVLGYLRAQKSRADYRADVLNRKGTIALGFGVVHRERHDLRALLGI